MRARLSGPFQTGPVAHPASCTMGTGCEAGGGVALTTHTYLTLRLKKK